MQKTKIEWVRNPDGTQGYTWNPLVGCKNDCEYCLTGNTLILTEGLTWIPINAMKRGDKIIGFKGKPSHRLVISQVKNVFHRSADCLKITTTNGELICTFNHPLLDSSRWRPAGRFRLNQCISLLIQPPSITYSVESIEYCRGYLAGVTEGDSTFNWTPKIVKYRDKQRYWRLAVIDDDILLRTRKYLNILGVNVEVRPFFSTNKPLKKIETRSYKATTIIKKAIEEQDSIDYYRGYLAGIFDSEGTISVK